MYCRLALAVVVLMQVATVPTYAQSVSATQQAEQHATAEVINCLAKRGANYPTGYCRTETPMPTVTPTSPPVVLPVTVATVIPEADTPTPTPTDTPCFLTDEATGDPGNNYDVIVPYVLADGSPALNDDGTQQYGPIPISCDSTPTPTPEPTDEPTAAAPVLPRSTAARSAARVAPAPVRAVAPAAAPTAVVPTDTPTPHEPTDTPTPTETATPSPTRTPTATSTPRNTVVPAIVSTPQPKAAEPEPRTVSWSLLLVVLGAAAALVGGGYAVYRWRRRHYLAQLQALEGET